VIFISDSCKIYDVKKPVLPQRRGDAEKNEDSALVSKQRLNLLLSLRLCVSAGKLDLS
jgi:hypothetical protein